jgi:hypothetical protein
VKPTCRCPSTENGLSAGLTVVTGVLITTAEAGAAEIVAKTTATNAAFTPPTTILLIFSPDDDLSLLTSNICAVQANPVFFELQQTYL